MATDLAARLGIRRTPPIRASAEVATPLIVGLPRPVILVPATRFFDLQHEQQRMAICHELAHIRRRDLWLGCVPAIAEHLFFFHPLAHVAAREYAFWREAACDAAVLEALEAAPQEYGRLLLDLGVSRPRTSLAAAGAPWSFSSLKRRISMLRDHSTRTRGSRAVAALAIGGAILLVAPLRLTARQAAVPASPAQTAVAAAAGRSARALEPMRPAQKTERRDTPASRFSYVAFVDENGLYMSGSQEDVARARQLRKPGEPLVWFRDGDREYIVRDPAVAQRIKEIWQPLGRIGAEQGRIGGEQGKLGARQGEIGKKQGEIGVQQGRLGMLQSALAARQAELALRQARMSLSETRPPTAAERAELENQRQQIDREMRRLDGEMRALGEQMRELEKPMQDLAMEMETLGKQMGDFGEQMREAMRKAQLETTELFERLTSSGAAQIVK